MRYVGSLGVIGLVASIAVSTSGVVACGSGACTAKTTIIASCTNAAGGFCVDYTGSEFTADAVNQKCTSLVTTYSASPCATAQRGGTCLVYCGKSSEALYRYYPSFPSGSGESQCTNTLKGVWTPG